VLHCMVSYGTIFHSCFVVLRDDYCMGWLVLLKSPY
jgi:hypothetical protein